MDEKKNECSKCNGTGNIPCQDCDGSGQSKVIITNNSDIFSGTKIFFGDSPLDCETCQGAGHVECPDCNGSGEVEDT
jgi:DnaJ-class molecular chaperone